MTEYAHRLRRAPGEVRAAVFEALKSLFEEVPAHEISVEMILDRAVISRSTFYAHYTSKYAAVADLLGSIEAEFDQVLAPWFNGLGPPEEDLRVSLSGVAAMWHTHRAVMNAVAQFWPSDPQLEARWKAMLDHYVNAIARRIDDLRASGEAPAGADSVAIARALAWGGERLHYIASRDMYGSKGEADSIEGLLCLWLGAIYQRAPTEPAKKATSKKATSKKATSKKATSKKATSKKASTKRR